MKIIEKHKDNILYYQMERFNKEDRMDHLFSSRIGWDQKDLFKDLAKIFQIERNRIYSGRQVHGVDVAVISREDQGEIGDKDGLITNIRGIALSTYHADCLPIYYYDQVNQVIGMAHAGWKGSLNNISQALIEKMIDVFDCQLKNIQVAIGPSIGSCCYEIGPDLEALFSERYPNQSDILIRRQGKLFLDLWKVNHINLLQVGIDPDKIYASQLCTGCNIDKLYSYRKEDGTKNRMIGAIILKP